MLNSRRRLAIAVISVFVSIFGLVAIQAWLHGQRYLNLRQNELIRIVDVAIAGLRPIIKAYNDGKIGYYQARQQVLRQIHDLGYQEGGDTNVFFVGTYDLVPMPLPQLPYSIHSVQVLSAMVEIARSPNANGFVRYNTSPEKTGNRISRRTRLAYLQGIPELELYVGTGLFTSDIRESILLAVLHSLVFGLIFASVSVGILIKSLRPVSNISWVLSEIFTRIAEDPNESLDTVYPEQLKWIEGQAIYNGLSRMLNSLRTARFKQEESEDRFRRLFSDSRDAIILTNGLQILECNQQAVKCFDKRRDELVGSDIRSLLLLSPSLADTMVDDILDRAVDGETVSASLILPARASEQSERTYELSIHPQYLGMEFGFQVVLHDITSIRQSERMLQNLNENLYRTLYSIGDGVITTDPDGIITRMNRVAEDLTEWNQEEAVGRRLQEVVQLRDINTGAHVVCSLEIILEIARDSNDGVSGEAREMITRRGRKRFVSENGAPIRTADYAISGGVVVFRDISNQLSMQRELHESQRILAMVLDNAPIGVGAFTRRGEFMYANPMLCQMLGYSAMQLRRQRFDAMVHQDDLRRNLRSFRRLMMGTKSESFEIRYLTRSGELRYAELSGGGVDAEQVHDRQGFVVVIIQDITDIKRAERESLEKEQLLIQAEKLAALGELSAGMAHEINQPLTGISMAADNLQLVATGQIPDRLISPGYVREKTEHIHEYIDRI
ncbi:MAG: PAS domain S-box protein, partial [Spirochaetaceae bacterium]